MAAAAVNAEQPIEAIGRSLGISDNAISQHYSNPLYDEDIHDSKDPFNDSNFDEEFWLFFFFLNV